MTAANISPAPRLAPLVLDNSGPVGVGVEASAVVVVLVPGGTAVTETGEAVGSTQVQVILAEQGSGPSVEVHVNVWPYESSVKSRSKVG